MSRRRWALAIALALGAADVRPEEPPKPNARSNDPILLDYARSNPSCTSFTDLCRTCIRLSDQIHCSTPGIACIQQPWRCTSDQPKKE
jgi:hypothetical protein